jgi:cytochrome c oxidase subunit 2
LASRRNKNGNLRRVAVAAAAWIAGCTGPQSAVAPGGPVADAIATLWWILAAGAAVILAAVTAAVLYAMFRRPERRLALPQIPFLIGAGLVFPTVTLAALVVYGTAVGRLITTPADDPVVVRVTGHRWWWEVHYPARDGTPEVVTANELHLPAGVPVELEVSSVDVIHSFWIPSLGGKIDMIPGRVNRLRVLAAEAGRFRGQCAEFCGVQHAHMGFVATAQSEAAFAEWLAARAAPAAVAALELRGFIERGCAECHTIAGSGALGAGGPVLTHFAARPTIGAATVGNTPEALRAWLRDHGRLLKPGSLGPATRELGDGDVETLAALLERLQ